VVIDHIKEAFDVPFNHSGNTTSAFDLAEGSVATATKPKSM
jgi:hypothetical protein